MEEPRYNGTYEEYFDFNTAPFERSIPVTELMKSGQRETLEQARRRHCAAWCRSWIRTDTIFSTFTIQT
jgi:hypothetical protein